MAQQAATTLDANEIGCVNLSLDRPLVCEPYRNDRELGSLILIDPITRRTVAAGLIDFSLRRADNIRWQTLDVDKSVRARLKQQRPCVLWFTGLSGAANRPSPISWTDASASSVATPRCSMATICATASIATSALQPKRE